jgi:hypothetical protein
MDFIDKTLIKLSSTNTRNALFDNIALEQILTACYDVDALPVNPPFQPIFDEFELGYVNFHTAKSEGRWETVGATEHTNLTLQISDLLPQNELHAEALWRGSIVAHSAPSSSTISDVDLNWVSSTGIDQDIIRDRGSLPTKPKTLEKERRKQLVKRLRERLDEPAIITDAVVDRLLADMSVNSVEEWMDTKGTSMPATTGVTFTPDQGLPPSKQFYPISAAILIRDKNFSLRDLLAQSKLLRERMDRAGIERAPAKGLPLRHSLLIIWIIPLSTFDDTDWPGANQAVRRVKAGQLLAGEGIGLVTAT